MEREPFLSSSRPAAEALGGLQHSQSLSLAVQQSDIKHAHDVRSKLPGWLTLFQQPLYVLHAGFHLGRPCHPEPLHEQELLLLLILLIGESSLAPLV